jgi:hypothetical protein
MRRDLEAYVLLLPLDGAISRFGGILAVEAIPHHGN